MFLFTIECNEVISEFYNLKNPFEST